MGRWSREAKILFRIFVFKYVCTNSERLDDDTSSELNSDVGQSRTTQNHTRESGLDCEVKTWRSCTTWRGCPEGAVCSNLWCVCDTNRCFRDEVCSKVLCDDFQCPQGWNRKMASMGKQGMTKETCCDEAPVCYNFVCPTGWDKKEGSVYVRGSDKETCCNPLPKCSVHSCSAGFHRKADAAKVFGVDDITCCDQDVPSRAKTEPGTNATGTNDTGANASGRKEIVLGDLQHVGCFNNTGREIPVLERKFTLDDCRQAANILVLDLIGLQGMEIESGVHLTSCAILQTPPRKRLKVLDQLCGKTPTPLGGPGFMAVYRVIEKEPARVEQLPPNVDRGMAQGNGTSWYGSEVPTCQGKAQSPINIPSQAEVTPPESAPNSSAKLVMGKEPPLNYYMSHWPDQNCPVWSTPSGMQVRCSSLGELLLPDLEKTLTLVQFNLRVPAEHSIDGKFADAELQMIYEYVGPLPYWLTTIGKKLMNLLADKSDEDLKTKFHEQYQLTDGAADLAAQFVAREKEKKSLLERSDEVDSGKNVNTVYIAIPLLIVDDKADRHLNFWETVGLGGDGRIPPPSEDPTSISVLFDLRSFGPMTAGDFYHYQGSQTAPPCYEGVHWYVMTKHGNISRRQVEDFNSIAPNVIQKRPVQPANGRTVVKNGFHVPDPARGSLLQHSRAMTPATAAANASTPKPTPKPTPALTLDSDTAAFLRQDMEAAQQASAASAAAVADAEVKWNTYRDRLAMAEKAARTDAITYEAVEPEDAGFCGPNRTQWPDYDQHLAWAKRARCMAPTVAVQKTVSFALALPLPVDIPVLAMPPTVAATVVVQYTTSQVGITTPLQLDVNLELGVTILTCITFSIAGDFTIMGVLNKPLPPDDDPLFVLVAAVAHSLWDVAKPLAPEFLGAAGKLLEDVAAFIVDVLKMIVDAAETFARAAVGGIEAFSRDIIEELEGMLESEREKDARWIKAKGDAATLLNITESFEKISSRPEFKKGSKLYRVLEPRLHSMRTAQQEFVENILDANHRKNLISELMMVGRSLHFETTKHRYNKYIALERRYNQWKSAHDMEDMMWAFASAFMPLDCKVGEETFLTEDLQDEVYRKLPAKNVTPFCTATMEMDEYKDMFWDEQTWNHSHASLGKLLCHTLTKGLDESKFNGKAYSHYEDLLDVYRKGTNNTKPRRIHATFKFGDRAQCEAFNGRPRYKDTGNTGNILACWKYRLELLHAWLHKDGRDPSAVMQVLIDKHAIDALKQHGRNPKGAILNFNNTKTEEPPSRIHVQSWTFTGTVKAGLSPEFSLNETRNKLLSKVQYEPFSFEVSYSFAWSYADAQLTSQGQTVQIVIELMRMLQLRIAYNTIQGWSFETNFVAGFPASLMWSAWSLMPEFIKHAAPSLPRVLKTALAKMDNDWVQTNAERKEVNRSTNWLFSVIKEVIAIGGDIFVVVEAFLEFLYTMFSGTVAKQAWLSASWQAIEGSISTEDVYMSYSPWLRKLLGKMYSPVEITDQIVQPFESFPFWFLKEVIIKTLTDLFGLGPDLDAMIVYTSKLILGTNMTFGSVSSSISSGRITTLPVGFEKMLPKDFIPIFEILNRVAGDYMVYIGGDVAHVAVQGEWAETAGGPIATKMKPLATKK